MESEAAPAPPAGGYDAGPALMDPVAARTTPAADESALLARLRARESDAFADLVRRHAARLQATARRLLRDEHEAEDAMQEAFLAAFRALDGFEGTSSVGTWLHRIVVNAALQRLRRRPLRGGDPVDDLLPRWQEDGHHATPPRSFVDAPDDVVARRELRALVRACIDRLPEDARTALVLRDVEEMPVADAAAAVGVTENAFKVRVHRARQALRTLLEPHLQRTSG